MDNSIIFMLLFQLILIALNATFACAEIAVITMNDNKLARLALEGDKRAIKLQKLTSQPAKFLATIQVAITLSGFLGSAFAADNFSDPLVKGLLNLGVSIPEKTLDTISVVIITLILSYVTLVFGELVPKRVAMRNAEKLALGISAVVCFIAKVFAPLVWLLTASTNTVLRLLGIDPNTEDEQVSEEEIRMILDAGSQKGVIAQEENQIIQNVFEFDDITAGEIATHRTEVSILWMDESLEEWKNTIHESRYTLYPVCNETVDDIVGILNAKDYFRLEDKSREKIMKEAVKPPYFVPESVKADVLFKNMKSTRNNFAIVLDEYGGMVGIVTMKDLIEQLIGDFETDEDEEIEEPNIERIDSKTWKIHGSAPLNEVAEALGIALPCEDYDTFNGLVFGTLGEFPEDGSSIEVEVAGLIIKVTEIRDHRVEKAIVCYANDVDVEKE